MRGRDDADEPWLDDEEDDAWNLDDDDEDSDVEPCPHCGAEVYEDAEQCPHCGNYLIRSTNPWHGKPWWWVVLGLAGVAAVLWWMLP